MFFLFLMVIIIFVVFKYSNLSSGGEVKNEIVKFEIHENNRLSQDEEDISKKRESFKNKIEREIEKISNNDEIDTMVENFIIKSPSKYFLDSNNIGEFEFHLGHKNKWETVLFLTDEYPQLRRENSKIQDFIHNDFNMLVRIISKNFNINNSIESSFLTYQLLKNGASKYFANLWDDSYGKYFKSTINMDEGFNLTELAKKYCEIDNIVHEDSANVGCFTYFIKKYYDDKEKKQLLFDNEEHENNSNKLIENYIPDDNGYDYEKLINMYEGMESYYPKTYRQDYLSLFYRLNELIKVETNRIKLITFEKNLLKKNDAGYTIDDIDLMGGLEFERFVAELFYKMGYVAEVTKASGDQGIDVIAEKNGRKIGIQAKCYSSKVTNSAIQEAVAGIQHYRLDKGMVITNNWFTASAQELAESNNIILWDRNRLKEKLSEITF